MNVGDIVKLSRSARRNGSFAGLTGLLVDIIGTQTSPLQVLLETGELVSLHITQIEEVINESR